MSLKRFYTIFERKICLLGSTPVKRSRDFKSQMLCKSDLSAICVRDPTERKAKISNFNFAAEVDISVELTASEC